LTVAIDASLTLAWLFEDEQTDAVLTVIDSISKEGAIVPMIWRYEVANGLQMAIKRKRIDAPYRATCFEKLRTLPIATDIDGVDEIWLATVALADLYQLTIYDAAYLELAQRMRVPLATLGDALARACKASAVPLFF
jgi:predicted nucleic acid-binding protein